MSDETESKTADRTQVNVRLPETLLEDVRGFALTRDLTVSGVVRQALEDYLLKQRRLTDVRIVV